MTLHHQKFHNKFRACIIVSLSGITRSAPRFYMGRWAALDEATMKKRGAKGVCGSNGNGSFEQGRVWLCNFFGIFGHCARASLSEMKLIEVRWVSQFP